jgi:radical SAM superfamily enzyme YgiQ (UPF0313 family)
MSQVVLISDNTFFGPTGISRYLGPYALANGLEAHQISTSVIDYFSRAPEFFEILEAQLSPQTLVVGVSSTFMSAPLSKEAYRSSSFSWDSASNYLITAPMGESPEVFDQWLKKLKSVLDRKCPNAKIVIGGAKVQSLFNYPETFFSSIDYVVWGPVDQIFHQICLDLQNDGVVSSFSFAGRKIIDTVEKYKQPKSCPSMAWKPHWNIQPGEALPIEISRGCRFNCKFCHYDKQEAFKKNMEDLRVELISNYELYGTQFYHFCDDCLNDHPEKVHSLTKVLLSLPFKIEWVSYVRVDVAVKFPETADLMVQSGARGLFWGLESFNQIAARKAGKGTPPDQVKRFLKDFYAKYGDTCTSLGSFIVGLPGETIDSQRETIDWVTTEPALHFVNVGPLRVAPYKQLFDKNVLDYADYSRNPEKHGFKNIEFSISEKNQLSENWSHETMNFTEAVALASEFVETWKASDPKRRGLVPSMWSYPHLRSLGYTHDEVFRIHFDESKAEHYFKDASLRFSNRLKDYFRDLRTRKSNEL